MEIKEVYEYLGQVRKKEKEIRRHTARMEELRSCLLPSGIRYDREPVQSSPSNQMENNMAKIDELERTVLELLQEKADLVNQISDMIERLEDDNEKTVLMEFYVARHSMEEAAKAINYSLPRTYYFRKIGVRNIGELLSPG